MSSRQDRHLSRFVDSIRCHAASLNPSIAKSDGRDSNQGGNAWQRWWHLESPQTIADNKAAVTPSSIYPLLGKIWSLCSPDKLLLSAAFFFMVAAAMAELSIPHYVTKSIFSAAVGGSSSSYLPHLQTLSALVLGFGITAALRGSSFNLLNQRMVMRLRGQLFSRLVESEARFFDENEVGSLTSRLQTDCQAITRCLSNNINIALRNFIQAVGGFVYLFMLHRDIGIATLAVTSVLWLITLTYGSFARRAGKVSQDVLACANSVAEEALSLSRVVRTFGSEGQEINRYIGWLSWIYRVGVRQACGYGLFVLSSHISSYASKVVALLMGCYYVTQGSMSPETLTNIVFYVEYVVYSGLNVCDEWTEFLEAVGASERVMKLLENKPAPQIAAGMRSDSFKGDILMKNVVFRYPSRPDQPALSGITLHLKPGSLTALVGMSGCGKSSVVACLQRLYDIESGSITVDGVNLTEVDSNWYRSHIGVVAQDPRLFSTSIAANIAYGLRDSSVDFDSLAESSSKEFMPGEDVGSTRFPIHASMSAIKEAAKQSNAHDFIMALPQGYETKVTDKLLSGGQRQRIALARALIRDPTILILDEATSALDAESEAQVQVALDRAMRDKRRTVLVVAHRLSTVRRADKIVVLDKGRVVEEGSHATLVGRRNGAYAALVSRQQGGWEEGPSSEDLSALGLGGPLGLEGGCQVAEAGMESEDTTSCESYAHEAGE